MNYVVFRVDMSNAKGNKKKQQTRNITFKKEKKQNDNGYDVQRIARLNGSNCLKSMNLCLYILCCLSSCIHLLYPALPGSLF